MKELSAVHSVLLELLGFFVLGFQVGMTAEIRSLGGSCLARRQDVDPA